MKKIDKALKTLSELYEFNKKIKKYSFSEQDSRVQEQTRVFEIKNRTSKKITSSDRSE